MNQILKILLLPFTLVYTLLMLLRNFFYDVGLFSTKSYDFPLICVGNLRVGGTGKTPHTEYLIEIFKEIKPIAVLSRGYGRKSKGFKIADSGDTVESIGDESFQIFRKCQEVIIAVDEKRRRGIQKLMELPAAPKLIILDDAFQHRSVKAGLNILLTEYSNLYINDLPMPSGRLRETKAAAKRADIIVVTKSPQVLSPLESRRIMEDLNTKPYQRVFFSYIKYNELKPLNQEALDINDEEDKLRSYGVLLLSAIANPQAIKLHLKRYSKELESLSFPDHHFFKDKDYKLIQDKLENLLSVRKMIVMTEKDAVKFEIEKLEVEVPVFYLPINVQFHEKPEENFDKEIKEYVRSYTRIR